MPARPKRSAKPGVIRLHDASGTSTAGWDAAVLAAVKDARKEISSPLAVEIDRMWAELDGTGIARYRVTVKVAYRQELASPRAPRAPKVAARRKARRKT